MNMRAIGRARHTDKDAKDYAAYMRIAIEEAKKGLAEGNRGYGAVIVNGSQVVARSHATATTESDITAHAELKAIRIASKKLGSQELEGSTLVATNEPCPMCAATTAWAGIGRIVYGASREDTLARSSGTRTASRTSTHRSGATPEVIAGILRDECLALHGPEG